jgi:2-aminoadipate transaminase
VLYDYLEHNDLDAHIATIRRVYGLQRNAMVQALKKYMPVGTKWTEPEGGMFVWLTLPEGYDSMELFERAIEKKVAFVPGNPFYPGDRDPRTMRLNYSCSDEATIEEGVRRLASAL